MADLFFPPLSSVISTEQLPEQLSFLSSGLEALLDKIYFRNLQTRHSLSGSTVSYELDIISFAEVLQLEIPGTGLILSLNPEASNPAIPFSVIPLSFSWSWGIQKYLRGFNVGNFSFGADAFYNLIFKVAQISDRDLLLFAISTFVEADGFL